MKTISVSRLVKSMVWVSSLFLMFAMVSCNEDAFVKLTESDVTVNNNSSDFAHRIVMYTHSGARTQSTAFYKEMPEAVWPSDYLVLDEEYEVDKAWDKDYLLPKDKSLTKELIFFENTYYIEGELTLSGYTVKGIRGKLVILPGGKLRYPADIAIDKLEIYNYGELEVVGGETLYIKQGGALLTKSDFDRPELSILCSGAVFVDHEMSLASMELSNNASVWVGCGLDVQKALVLENNAAVYVRSFLSADKIQMGSASLLTIAAKALVSTKELEMRNPSATVSVTPLISVEGEEMEYAVLSADKIIVSHQNVKKMFEGWLDIHYEEIINKSGAELEWLSNIKLNGDTYLPEEGCHPEFGEKPQGNDPEVGLEHVADVVCPEHVHDLSATCIQNKENLVYVSYHTRGSEYHGCIEVLKVSKDYCAIVSHLEHPAVDFNHLIVDGSRIVAASDDIKNGATLGMIDLYDGGVFKIGEAKLTQVDLKGASANCVIRNGAYLHATTNEGYQTLDASSFETLASVATPGSAKYVCADGPNLGVLNLANQNAGQSEAILNLYSSADYKFSSSLRSLGLGVISPVNGKNVFCFDGNDVYVCLGSNGVKLYKDGVETASFKLEEENTAANGLAVDGKYLYVAYGNGGLFVLDKTDLSVVTSYRLAGGKSANYVSVSGDILYVAYGLSGVQIFRLIEK